MREYEVNQQLNGNSPHMIYRSLFVETCPQEANKNSFEIMPSIFNWLFSKTTKNNHKPAAHLQKK